MSDQPKKKGSKKDGRGKKGRTSWVGRIYLGEGPDGEQLYHWVGRFPTKSARDKAVKEERERLANEEAEKLPTCDEYVDRFLADAWQRLKRSTAESYEERLQRFRADFAGRSLGISRQEAKEWTYGEGRWEDHSPASPGEAQTVVTLHNQAIDEDDLPLARNPFRKLGKRSKGRAEELPPTIEQFEQLLDACAVLGDYAPVMRAMTLFSAFELMRPGEVFMISKPNLDFARKRVRKQWRLHRGRIDVPKTGPVTIALTPPARDAVLSLPKDGPEIYCTGPNGERIGPLLFYSKAGKRLSQPLLSGYWAQVCAAAGFRFDFYLSSKHYGVWYMWRKLGISRQAIAAQAGWSLATVDKMLEIYGHGEVGALEEVDAAFERADVPRLRKIEGGGGP